MGIRHKNQWGYTEYVDRLPVPGCDCNKCSKAREKRNRSIGRTAVAGASRETWSKYSSSTSRDTGLNQTDYFEGYVGEKNQNKKVHIAIDETGEVLLVRDIDGTVLYDRKHGIGILPPDLNWSRIASHPEP